MILKEIRIMRGPNMWSTDYRYVLAAKFDPLSIPALEGERQKAIIEYLRSLYGIEPLYEDFSLCIFHYTLQLCH